MITRFLTIQFVREKYLIFTSFNETTFEVSNMYIFRTKCTEYSVKMSDRQFGLRNLLMIHFKSNSN